MNKQIAIDILEKEKAYMQQHAGKAQVEAFDMAICALRISEQEIRNKAIDGLRCKLIMYFADCQLIEENAIDRDFFDGVIERIDEIAERLKEVEE